MISQSVLGILGKRAVNEMTSAGGIPAVDSPALGMVARRPGKVKIKRGAKMRRLGEDDNQPIIPDNAVEVDTDTQFGTQNTAAKAVDVASPRLPVNTLIKPAIILVAPDVTPDALVPLEPAQVPAPTAINTLLGKVDPNHPAPAPQSAQQTQSQGWTKLVGMVGSTANSAGGLSLPGIPPVGSSGGGDHAITDESALSSEPMPEPAKSNPGAIMEAFKRFAR